MLNNLIFETVNNMFLNTDEHGQLILHGWPIGDETDAGGRFYKCIMRWEDEADADDVVRYAQRLCTALVRLGEYYRDNGAAFGTRPDFGIVPDKNTEEAEALHYAMECWEQILDGIEQETGSAEELEYKRRRQRSRGLPPVYDRAGMRLTDEEKAKLEAEGRRPHYRFMLEHKETSWDDLVRGRCSYNGAHLSDPIIVREDGTFPYMLPSVIDDMDFGVTHIIRGEDHVTNTAVQIQMFEVLGGRIPVFGHPPLLTGKEGKLSKRLGSLSSRELRAEGIEPMTIASLLARLGTSDPVIACHGWTELAEHFDLTRFGRAQPHFDTEDLFKFNPHVVRSMPLDQVNARLKERGEKEISEDFWRAVSPNIDKIADIAPWEKICFSDEIFSLNDDDRAFCRKAAELMPAGDFDETTFSAWTAAVKENTGRKGKELFHPLRLALTGCGQGPELKMLLPVLGRQRTITRLQG